MRCAGVSEVSPRVTFTLRCRVLGCGAACVVYVTRSNDPRVTYLETSSLLVPPGWTLMFRQHDSGSLTVAPLCSEHARIFDDVGAPEVPAIPIELEQSP